MRTSPPRRCQINMVFEKYCDFIPVMPVFELFFLRKYASDSNNLHVTHCCLILGAAAPGFNSLISAPSVPSLISTEPVELLCRASDISSTNPFCFVKQKQEAVEAFLQCFIYKYAQLFPACAGQKFTAIKTTTQPE